MTTLRALTLAGTLDLVTEECCNCGVLFAVTTDFRQRCLDSRGPSGKVFYCPNGHRQWYTGKTEAQLAQEAAARLATQVERANQRAASAQEDARAAHASLVATKGHLTRARKRAAHGVCPCCSRTFADVARHVAGQHPDFVRSVT